MNNITQLCERMGSEADKLRRAIGSALELGSVFYFQVFGFGGSCFPKDV
jgi:UDPglucose 6-dehydrogenase